jgi:hypothetical protein
MTVNIQFPPNPEDGMIFEAISGVFYKYNAGSNCWTRLKGVDNLGLATPLIDGLMSKEDFTKLQNLIIPPPQATLKGEDCETTFKSGTVALYSFDESLEISKNPKITNKTPLGRVEEAVPWQLHRNTAGFDFRAPIERIIQEVEERNRLKKVQLQGDKGYKGKRGEPGIDRLDTGPVGEEGIPGINSPFGGTLVTEPIPFELAPGSNNRAIVDIITEEVSETENYLVATRANIGNPDACPALVTPKNFDSALVVALNVISGGKLIKDQTITSGDCALICRICASSLHHLDVEDLVCAVFDQFVVRVNQLKTEKENLVRAWLSTMISLFSEQKAALCCALENCRSRQRNERTRQYIETQRIQAAQGDFALIIDGGGENRQVTDMDAHKSCPVDVSATPPIVIEGDCLIANLDAKMHITDPRTNGSQAPTSFLGVGSYVAEITGCCANFNDNPQNSAYSGRVGILYQALTRVGEGSSVQESVGPAVVTFPNFGSFSNESAARNAYQGVTLTFEHNGGDISFWLLDPDGFSANNAGQVQITVKPVVEEEGSVPPAEGVVFVYRDEVSFEGLLGSITPYVGDLTAEENFGDLTNNVNLTFGPPLVKDRAQIFFYEGTDGLSMFFVAGELPSSDNDQLANILVDTNISNNPFNTSELASDADADVRQLSSSDYTATLMLNGNSSGYAIGAFDINSDYAVRVDPRDLSTMRTFAAVGALEEFLVISEGGSEGIGGTIAVTQSNSAPLFHIRGIQNNFGGGNETGLRINNESSGQSVYVTRPVEINTDATFDSTTISDPTAPAQAPPSVPTQILKTRDDTFASSDWSEVSAASGRTGSTAETSTGSSRRETTHTSSGEGRRLASTGRPSKSFFGPGSAPALPWDQSYASDQFGNTWVFIRAVDGRQGGGAPHKNGSGDVFIRDAVASETWVFGDRLASNLFPGGSSGLQEGAQVIPGAAGGTIPAVITTFHNFSPVSHNPSGSELFNVTVDLGVAGQADFDFGAVVSQDNKIYATTKTVSVGQAATTIGISGGEKDFGLVNPDGSINPDINPSFSSGPPITFGYSTRSTHTSSDSESKTTNITSYTICIEVPDSPSIPPGGGIPPSIIEEKGEFVDEEASSLPRGASGSPQDPCIADITISLRSSAPQSIRYILTDNAGVKFYSAFRDINVLTLNAFQLLSFGPPVTILDPPPEFTTAVITGKTIEVSEVSSQLDAQQVSIAESLDGLARLSYIQSILGTSSDAIPNSRNITDLEFQLRNTPFSSIDVGFVSAQIGLPGAITEVLIDNFEIQEIVVGQTEAEPEIVQGSTKRVVATQTGSDSSVTGLIYAGIDNYFGDYNGRERGGGGRNVDFNGNNFFLLNRAGGVITQVTAARGFNNVGSQRVINSQAGVQNIDTVAVNDFGVVYIADGPNGRIIATLAQNAEINNADFGDANDASTNTTVILVEGLPITNNAIITMGTKKVSGSNYRDEIIANFGGQWFRIDGIIQSNEFLGPHRADVTTLRCCWGGNPPGPKRMTAVLGGGFGGVVPFANGPAGNSITIDRKPNPQPSIPGRGGTDPRLNGTQLAAIGVELARDFDQFNLFVLDDDVIYQVNRGTGVRTPIRGLGEKAFGLRANPRTKDLYYITNDRGTTPSSGSAIRRVDIDDLDPNNDDKPKIKTVYNAEVGEGIFGITFGNSVPTDPTTKNQVLYALTSTLRAPDQGLSVTARLLEISELVTPPVPPQPISQEIPVNATWSSSVSGGRLLGNPSTVIFSRLPPGGGCQMHYKQVQWYERGWRIGACCGALVENGGAYYIVVKRSIGTDLSCGGGESLSNGCISQFINSGEGHPALAWPTTVPIQGDPPGGGGDEFLGIPTSGFTSFVKDQALSTALLNKIQAGNVLRTVGKPATEIPFILFPSA